MNDLREQKIKSILIVLDGKKEKKAVEIVATSLAVGCFFGFICLMIRPAYWPIGMFLGFGTGGGIGVSHSLND